MILSEEYIEFLITCTRVFSTRTMSEQLLHVAEEVGEASEAWIGVVGANPRLGKPVFRERDVAMELADVVNSALVGIIKLGFDPRDFLEQQQIKTQERIDALA